MKLSSISRRNTESKCRTEVSLADGDVVSHLAQKALIAKFKGHKMGRG